MNALFDWLSTLSTSSLIVVVLFIFGIFMLLPNVLKNLGLKKIGMIELQRAEHQLNKDIIRFMKLLSSLSEIDDEMKDKQWENAIFILDSIREKSVLGCSNAINSILGLIERPILRLIMLNHLDNKLQKDKIEETKDYIIKQIKLTFKNVHNSTHACCPILEDVGELTPSKYINYLDEWLESAKIITIEGIDYKIAEIESYIGLIDSKDFITELKNMKEALLEKRSNIETQKDNNK